jgi:hypothetical protein
MAEIDHVAGPLHLGNPEICPNSLSHPCRRWARATAHWDPVAVGTFNPYAAESPKEAFEEIYTVRSVP